MKVEIEVPEYSRDKGVETQWDDGFTIETSLQNNTFVIEADVAGLVSLARYLLAIAQAPVGSHIHLDENNSLEEGSYELIIAKM